MLDNIEALAGGLFFLHALINLLLIMILNPTFEPDFPPRVGATGLFFAYVRALNFSGAVIFPRVRRTVFHAPDYDFKGRVSGIALFLCWTNHLLLFAGFGCVIASGVIRAWVHPSARGV